MAKVTKSLKKSFPKAKKPAFDFDHAVAEAYEMFPHIQNSVFFVNAKTGKLIHPDAETLENMNTAIEENTALKESLAHESMMHRKNQSSSCLPMTTDSGGRITFIFLYMEDDLFRVLGDTCTLDQDRYLIFDHELAHTAIPGAFTRSVESESVADVYASLRHFQRYGTNTGVIETLVQRRAALAFLGNDSLHFTCQALENALSFQNDSDFNFKTMTPGQIAAMAKYIGSHDNISRKELNTLSYHFAKVYKTFQKACADEPLRGIAECALGARAPIVNKWGMVALQAFLQNKASLLKGKKKTPVPLNSFYWDNIRAAVKAQDNTLPNP